MDFSNKQIIHICFSQGVSRQNPNILVCYAYCDITESLFNQRKQNSCHFP
jgi:hypothetical protein